MINLLKANIIYSAGLVTVGSIVYLRTYDFGEIFFAAYLFTVVICVASVFTKYTAAFGATAALSATLFFLILLVMGFANNGIETVPQENLVGLGFAVAVALALPFLAAFIIMFIVGESGEPFWQSLAYAIPFIGIAIAGAMIGLPILARRFRELNKCLD